MSYTSAPRKAKLTVTISGDVINEIDAIARRKGAARSKVMEEALRDWLFKSKKKSDRKRYRGLLPISNGKGRKGRQRMGKDCGKKCKGNVE